jgi:hypothetical protein
MSSTNATAGDRLAQRNHIEVRAPIGRGKLRPEMGGDAVQIRACLVERNSRREPAYHCPITVTARARVLGLNDLREPDFCPIRPERLLGHHADQDARDTVEDHGATDERAVSAEPVAPQRFGEQHDVVVTWLELVRCEGAAQQRSEALNRKCVGRDEGSLELLGSFRPDPIDAPGLRGS